MAHRTPTIDVVVRDEVTRALERQMRSMRAAGGEPFAGIRNGFKGLESGIESLARGISREFGTLLRMTGGGLLGAGFVAGIQRTTQALGNVARAAQQHRYLAEQLGLTNAQLSNMVAHGRALGMSTEQTTSGITSLSKNLRELKMLGENSGIYKALVEAGGASGARFGDKLIAATRGPGGYDAGMRTFVKLMSETNAQAQRKLSDLFGLGSIAFRDLNSYGLQDIPKVFELAAPAARELTRSMEVSAISWNNIKVAIGGALIGPFEQFTRTISSLLQGPGQKVVEEFGSWVKAINIPWDDIGKALKGGAELLESVFKWIVKAIKEADPLVKQIGGWEPILLAVGTLFAYGSVSKVTWSLMAIGFALQEIGKHEVVLKAIVGLAAAARSAAPTGVSSMTGGGQTSQFGSPYSKNIEDRRGQRPTTGGSSGQRSGYNLMGGGNTGADDEQGDKDALRVQVEGATRQLLRLANFVTGDTSDTGDTGQGPGPARAAASPQIRTGPRAGPRAAAPGPRAPAPPPAPPATPPATPGPKPPAGPTPPAPPPQPTPSGPTPPTSPTSPPAPTPAGPSGPATPPAPAPTTPPTGGGGGKGVLLFAHGIVSRYGNYSIEQVEADARRYAKAHGYSGVVFIYGTPAQQEKEMRDRVKAGGVGGLVGFSGGAGPARRVGNDTGIPTTTYGNPNVPGDTTIPGVKHMPQTAAHADQAERQNAAAGGGGPQQPSQAQPQAPTTPGGPTTLPEVTVTAPRASGTGRVQQAQGRVAGIRKLDIDPRLQAALDYAAGVAGVTVRVTSGGQDPHGAHTGSHRHDYGRAADLDLLDENGNILRRGDPRRLKFLKAAASVGAGGIGTSYMNDPGKLKMHIGITGKRAIVGEGLGSYAGTPDEKRAVAEGLAIFYADREAAKRKLAGSTEPVTPLPPSPIVWSNEDEINRLKEKKELEDEFPLGGFTPIPGRGNVKLKISMRGPRGVKVSGEGSGAVGPATIDRSDPSGGIEGFSPA